MNVLNGFEQFAILFSGADIIAWSSGFQESEVPLRKMFTTISRPVIRTGFFLYLSVLSLYFRLAKSFLKIKWNRAVEESWQKYFTWLKFDSYPLFYVNGIFFWYCCFKLEECIPYNL